MKKTDLPKQFQDNLEEIAESLPASVIKGRLVNMLTGFQGNEGMPMRSHWLGCE